MEKCADLGIRHQDSCITNQLTIFGLHGNPTTYYDLRKMLSFLY